MSLLPIKKQSKNSSTDPRELEFIELNRRFVAAGDGISREDMAASSYLRHISGQEHGLGWDDLLQKHLVIVLGEPYSGKTREFEHRASLLRRGGLFSLFVRLDRLVNERFDQAIGSDDNAQFQKWIKSTKEGYFFFDSVDEAKFSRLSDFYVSLDRIRDALGSQALRRARLFISSRIWDWQPQTDRSSVLQRFSPAVDSKAAAPSLTLSSKSDVSPSGDILVVQLEPLDESRIKQFAQAKDPLNASLFIEALEESSAWEFVRRPGDVVDMLNYWKKRNRFGPLSELMDFDVQSKLQLPQRDSGDTLSPQRAREGVETLAAAAILCRQFSFRIHDPNSSADSLEARSCLPNAWSDREVNSLLDRPIFDVASYGSIRFHHRRIVEYLAAQWIERMIKNGCPSDVIRDLLFIHKGEEGVIRSGLAPVAAWLCCGNEKWNAEVRAWVLRASPDILLQYGDPQSVTVSYRLELLKAFVERLRGRDHVWIESSRDNLKRFADPGLSQYINTVVREKNISIDIRQEMMTLARFGQIRECLEVALEVIASENEPDTLRSHAAALVRDVGDQSTRLKLAVIARQLPSISNGLCSRMCEALYPGVIKSDQLVDILRKTEPVPDYSVDLPDYLEWHLKEAVNQECTELLKSLLALGQEPPHIVHEEGSFRISAQFHWVSKTFSTLLIKLFSKNLLSMEEVELSANAIRFLTLANHYTTGHHHNMSELLQALRHQPLVRRAYHWQLVTGSDKANKKESLSLRELYDHYELFSLDGEDLEWMIQDIRSQESYRDRSLALRFALELERDSKTGRYYLRRIRRAIKNDPRLRKRMNEWHVGALRMWWGRNIFWKAKHLSSKWLWIHQLHRLRVFWIGLRYQVELHLRIDLLLSGKAIRWLANLSREAAGESSHHSPTEWSPLRKKRGRLITWAAKVGCKRSWRSYRSPLPHEKTRPNSTMLQSIVCLAGIQAAFTDGDISIEKLTDDEVKLMTRHATNELNGFPPWFKEVAARYPKPVSEVLSECVRGEWLFKSDRENAHEVMYDVLWGGEELSTLVRSTVLELLKVSDPDNIAILQAALAILLGGEEPALEEISELAENRARKYAGGPQFNLWLTVWLQVAAGPALDFLEEALSQCEEPNQLMLDICLNLKSDRARQILLVKKPSYLSAVHLKRLLTLIFKHIRPEDDIQHGSGVYTPEARDDVQRFRGILLEKLANSEAEEADAQLEALIGESPLQSSRDFIVYLIEARKRKRADMLPWSPKDVRDFEVDFEIEPKTDSDLFKLILRRLDDIKHDVEISDDSIRRDLHPDDDERRLRQWLAKQLSNRSSKKYIVPQEVEIDRQERPDIRVEHPKVRGPIPIEVKLIEKWSLSELQERLENQLLGQYMRDHNTRFGIYFLGYVGEKSQWIDNENGQKLDYESAVQFIAKRALELTCTTKGISEIAVVGVNFRDPHSR